MPPLDPFSAGASPVVLTPGARRTYIAQAAAFTPYATPTDIITLPGNATTVVRVLQVIITGTQTTAGINLWSLIKRAVANTGGTSSALTAVPVDSGYAAASSIPKKWTAAPTIDSAVGSVGDRHILAPAPASVAPAGNVLYEAGPYEAPITLRGVAEELALNFGGAAVPTGLSIGVFLKWTEE